jgi:hypothetical protein
VPVIGEEDGRLLVSKIQNEELAEFRPFQGNAGAERLVDRCVVEAQARRRGRDSCGRSVQAYVRPHQPAHNNAII